MRRVVTPWIIALGGLLLGLGVGAALFLGFFPSTPRDDVAEAEDTSLIHAASASSALPLIAPVEGAQAPDFTLRNLAGESVRLGDLRGRVVLVNFWATWCESCRLEMPMFEEAYERYGSPSLEVVAVDFDEPLEDVKAFLDELGLSFHILLDPDGKVERLYRVIGIPTSFFVDPEGTIRVEHVGPLDEELLDRYLERAGLPVQ